MKEISFGKIAVPLEQYAVQGNAILGIRGSGKSYTGTYLAEQLMDGGVPVTAVDPIGIWRFLRVPGKGPGYPVVIVGGEHGDLPLTPASAEATMRAAMAARVSIVFDLYDVQLSKRQWRDIVVSIVNVLLFENKKFGPRHIFVEEAAEFVPQRIGPDQGVVYDKMERLVRMGGNAQLGVTLINQRAEEVNKAVLDLCDCLVLHRQKGRNSLINLTKWLDVAGVQKLMDKDAVAKKVPQLKNGEAFVWPEGAEQATLTKIPVKSSYHPDRKAMKEDAQIVDAEHHVDTTTFVEKMKQELAKAQPAIDHTKDAATYQKHVLSDPMHQKMPKAADMNAEFMASHESAMVKELRHQLVSEYQRGQGQGEIMGAHNLATRLDSVLGDAVTALNLAGEHLRTLNAALEAARSGWTPGIASHPKIKAAQKASNEIARQFAAVVGCPFDKPERLILTALRQYAPDALAKARIAILARYAVNGGGFKNALGRLRTSGMITQGEPIELTEKGRAAIEPYYLPLPTGQELVQYWKAHLDKPGRLILEAVVEAYPASLTKGQVASRAGYEADGGGFKNALGRMRTLELIKGSKDIKASEVFFQ